MAAEPTVVCIELGTTAFRYSDYDTPFWARNNRSEGRWHVPADGATQYLALHPEGAWAELGRRENLRTEEELALVHMPIWATTLNEGGLADYRTFDKAEAAGFPPDAFVDDDYARCQEEGRRLRENGLGGVIAPSAALPGAVNVTLFGRRVLSTWGMPTRLASSIPACVVAVGCPPEGLAIHIRHFGATHVGYAHWVAKVEEDRRAQQLDADPANEGARIRRRPDQDPDDQAAGSAA